MKHVLIILVMLLATTAQAEYLQRGAGVVDCAHVVSLSSDDHLDELAMQYFLGVLTAANMNFNDNLSQGYSDRALGKWLLNDCRAHPTDPYWKSIERLHTFLQLNRR
jgi:hypothetical protein